MIEIRLTIDFRNAVPVIAWGSEELLEGSAPLKDAEHVFDTKRRYRAVRYAAA